MNDMQRELLTHAIVADVAVTRGVSIAKLRGRPALRAREWQARQDAYVALRASGLILREIGRAMNRDHSSVLHGIREHAARHGVVTP